MYKTSDKQRANALAYYYANREARLAYAETRRRSKGIQPPKPPMTDEEKLAVVRVCKCGRQVTTPALLLKCSNVCRHCKAQTKTAKACKKRSTTKHRQSPTHLKALTRDYKLEKGCQMCGSRPTDATTLHFHHRDPATKAFKVADGVYRKSREAMWTEIAKCDVLCKTCHDAVHAA